MISDTANQYPLLSSPHGSGSNGAIYPPQTIATSSSIMPSAFAPFVPPQGMDLGNVAADVFSLPSGGTSLYDSPGSNVSALMMAQSPSPATASTPERAAKRRLPSPARMVDVGRVAHPRVDMSDGSPEGQAAGCVRQRHAGAAFFVQVQDALNGVVQNVQNHDKFLAQWRDYLNNFHENHKVSYESLVDRVQTLENQVKVVEGT